MSEKQIMIDLDDPRAGKISEILGNKSCKQILGILADKEMSVGEIATELKIPLNTADYNVKKLVDSGLIEESKGFLWSVKGKRVLRYKIARKKIVIFPKTTFKGLLPALLASGIGALVIRYVLDGQSTSVNSVRSAVESSTDKVMAGAQNAASSVASNSGANIISTASSFGEPALWFLLGALIALFVFLVWNWRKIW